MVHLNEDSFIHIIHLANLIIQVIILIQILYKYFLFLKHLRIYHIMKILVINLFMFLQHKQLLRMFILLLNELLSEVLQ